jgi:hypothetical protein
MARLRVIIPIRRIFLIFLLLFQTFGSLNGGALRYRGVMVV